MNFDRPFWYRDDDGDLYDTEFQRALKLSKFAEQYPDLDPNHNPMNNAYMHDTSGNYQFKTKMVRRPFDTYLVLYNRYRQLTSQEVITPEDRELIKRHRNVMGNIRATFNTMGFVIPELPIMNADKNTLQLTNEDNIRDSITRLENRLNRIN